MATINNQGYLEWGAPTLKRKYTLVKDYNKKRGEIQLTIYFPKSWVGKRIKIKVEQC